MTGNNLFSVLRYSCLCFLSSIKVMETQRPETKCPTPSLLQSKGGDFLYGLSIMLVVIILKHVSVYINCCSCGEFVQTSDEAFDEGFNPRAPQINYITFWSRWLVIVIVDLVCGHTGRSRHYLQCDSYFVLHFLFILCAVTCILW